MPQNDVNSQVIQIAVIVMREKRSTAHCTILMHTIYRWPFVKAISMARYPIGKLQQFTCSSNHVGEVMKYWKHRWEFSHRKNRFKENLVKKNPILSHDEWVVYKLCIVKPYSSSSSGGFSEETFHKSRKISRCALGKETTNIPENCSLILHLCMVGGSLFYVGAFLHFSSICPIGAL